MPGSTNMYVHKSTHGQTEAQSHFQTGRPDGDRSSQVFSGGWQDKTGVKTDRNRGSEGPQGAKCLMSGWKTCLRQEMGTRE